MMNSEGMSRTSCFQQSNANTPDQGFDLQMYEGLEDLFLSSSSSTPPASNSSSNTNTTATFATITTTDHLLSINLSLLREKVQRLQSLITSMSTSNTQNESAPSKVVSLTQEIISAASSIMFSFQHIAALAPPHHHITANYNNNNSNITEETVRPADDHVIELEAADLVAKYTHLCNICGKGFKRDTNLRMHMRSHGDEYKSNAALAKPMTSTGMVIKKMCYSCPQEGCRWNKNHAKFQPLKSMVSVKNHYKRSHCPKMYVCNRCNLKHFSLLLDLQTHQKHCGDENRWRCSCGTSFCRKDKLLGHVAVFPGHAPATLNL